MNEVIMHKDGEVVDFPSVDLDVKAVEHMGIKLFMFTERREGGEPKFVRIIAPSPEKTPEGFGTAARDYLENVIGLGSTLAMELLHDAVRQQREHVEFLKGAPGSQPWPAPVVKDGPPARKYVGKVFGDVERDDRGARIIYRQSLPADQVLLVLLDRKGNPINASDADIWSHCWTAYVPGYDFIAEHAMSYVVLYENAERDGTSVRLDYSYAHAFRLPAGKVLSDYKVIEVGYHNMELRGSPPPYSPGAVQPK